MARERERERELGKSVLTARHDDDDDDVILLFTQSARTCRKRHKINVSKKFNWFGFRVFLLLYWLSYKG